MALVIEPLPFRQAIDSFVARDAVLPDDYYGRLIGRERALSFTVAGLTRIEHVRSVMTSLTESMRTGESFARWRERALKTPALQRLPDYRLDNIYRTNVQGAYAAGRCVHIKAHQDRRPFLLYSAIRDIRVRERHLKMHATLLPTHHPFWASHTPPNGYRCRCSVISMTARQAERRGGATAVPDEAEVDKGWGFSPCEPERSLSQAIDRMYASAIVPTGGVGPSVGQVARRQVGEALRDAYQMTADQVDLFDGADRAGFLEGLRAAFSVLGE